MWTPRSPILQGPLYSGSQSRGEQTRILPSHSSRAHTETSNLRRKNNNNTHTHILRKQNNCVMEKPLAHRECAVRKKEFFFASFAFFFGEKLSSQERCEKHTLAGQMRCIFEGGSAWAVGVLGTA